MKLFGSKLFNYKKDIKIELLYDFAQHGLLETRTYGLEYVSIANNPLASGTSTASSVLDQSVIMVKTAKPEEPKKEDKKDKKTPKELYVAKALNNNEFKIRIDALYLAEQIQLIRDKLDYIDLRKKVDTSGGTLYGKKELESMLTRLKNRKKIKSFQKVVDEYPHTTSEQIAVILKEHDNLRCEKASEFIPDMPKDAMAAIKQYDQMCEDLCHQRTNFYIVADKKDFGVKDRKRDPILLAQSPFGFFWQILGAWDREMVYLGEI